MKKRSFNHKFFGQAWRKLATMQSYPPLTKVTRILALTNQSSSLSYLEHLQVNNIALTLLHKILSKSLILFKFYTNTIIMSYQHCYHNVNNIKCYNFTLD